MKWLLALAFLLCISCAGRRYDPDVFRMNFQHSPGIAGKQAEVGIPFTFGLLFTGPLPTVPVCMVLSTDLTRDRYEIRESCGMLVKRLSVESVTFSVGEYMMLYPPPYQIPMAGEYEEPSMQSGTSIDPYQDPNVRITVSLHYAEPDDTGRLIRKKQFARVSSKGIRLSCRYCAW